MRYSYILIFISVLLIQISFTGCKEQTDQAETPIPCDQRAVFGNPDSSEYILPYPAGKGYYLSQSYCNPTGGHKNQLAYDFAMSIGDTVCAARGGTVKEVKEDLYDSGNEPDAGAHNHVMIQHDDGTVAFYAHLMRESVIIKVNDVVQQGEVIALSGNSGNTGGFPHLHFGVYQGWPMKEGFDVAVNFINADGPLDAKGGLVKDKYYKALPW
jgi:murein DD-endopeptidase MepM/ murein hydrolase activator NlpD